MNEPTTQTSQKHVFFIYLASKNPNIGIPLLCPYVPGESNVVYHTSDNNHLKSDTFRFS